MLPADIRANMGRREAEFHTNYDNLLTVADFLCVRGFRDLRAEPQFYDGACVLT